MPLATDPVCKMKVDENSARFKSGHAGMTYYFCSPECKRVFDNNPQKYVPAKA